MAFTVQSSPPRSNRSWLRVLAFLFTALLGWFIGAYVGSMFSGPPETAILTEQPSTAASANPTEAALTAQPAQISVPSAAALATAVPTAIPTSAPLPTPPGRGAVLQGDGLAIQLIDYELRPDAHAENAAIKYTLRLTNSANRPTEVKLNLADIVAMDSNGVQYRDYYAVSNEFAEARCGVDRNGPKYQMDVTIQMPGLGTKQFDFYLNRGTTEGNCANRGDGRSRLDPTAQFVDLQLGRITYTAGGPRELQSGWWRLNRGG